ncbi:phosphotransferase family protein [Salinisphaera hydrothermalis]|uniref:phosphotransferase family protein n=1 Tax=Salinisphaera hydrothermalis TaxID=563188 RepID=UPI00333EE048
MPLVLGETASTPPPELIDVSSGRRFNVDALARHLAARGFDCGPLSVQQFAGAKSNPTFLVSYGRGAGASKFVLRKSAADAPIAAYALDREYRVMQALADTPAVPVPAMHAFCADESVLGAPFYIMDYVAGRTLSDSKLDGLSCDERGAVYRGMIDTLAALHNVDADTVGLSEFGRPRGYLARQVTAWRRQYEHTAGDPDPAMMALAQWLEQNLPADAAPVITHGDYRVGNLMLSEGGTDLAAVLDWEMATLGHPMADLAYACLPYYLPEDIDVLPGIAGLNLVEWGIPDESELLKRYRAARGLAPIDEWPAFIAFALFGIAAFAQAVQARSPGGRHGDEARRVACQVSELAELGWQMARYHDTAC